MVFPIQARAGRAERVLDESEIFWILRLHSYGSDPEHYCNKKDKHTTTQKGVSSLSASQPLSFRTREGSDKENDTTAESDPVANGRIVRAQADKIRCLHPHPPRRGGGQAQRRDNIEWSDRTKLNLEDLMFCWQQAVEEKAMSSGKETPKSTTNSKLISFRCTLSHARRRSCITSSRRFGRTLPLTELTRAFSTLSTQ